MLNTVATITRQEFTVKRTVNKIERVLTETNVLLAGKKTERTDMAGFIILDQWNGGHFVSMLATFSGALGPMVSECVNEAAKLLNAAAAINGTVGTFDAAKPNRILTALALGSIINVLESKAAKTKSGVMKGASRVWHGVAKDLTAKYAAACLAKADKAALTA